MFKNYIKITLRNIMKHKTISMINIFGLSVGMGSCILIVLYIYSELNVNSYHEKKDNIYQLCAHASFGTDDFTTSSSNATAAAVLKNDYPEVLNTVRLGRKSSSMVKIGNEKYFLDRIGYADDSVFDIFTWPMIKGDPTVALQDPYSIVLTEETAKIFFGDQDPLGQTVEFGEDDIYKVTGVIENIPDNSSRTYNAFCSFKTLYAEDNNSPILTNWSSHNFQTFLLLQNNFDYKELEQKFPDLIQKYIGEELVQKGRKLELFLNPMKNIYLKPMGKSTQPIFYVYVFSVIAIIVLLIACVNFMNLSTSRSLSRSREIGIRKVLGAFRKKIVFQFLTESIIFSVISLIIAFVLVETAMPYITNLIGYDISLNFFTVFWAIPGLFALVLFTGILAGSYPAFFLSKFQPVIVLKGKTGSQSTKSNLRKLLVILQFAVSIVLITVTGLVINQLNYMRNKDVGFQKDHVVVIRASDSQVKGTLQLAKNELSKCSGVLNVALSSTIPGWGAPSNVKIPHGHSEEAPILMDDINVDPGFIPALNIEILEGRNFSDEYKTDIRNSVIINETAVKKFNIQNPIGKTIKTFDYVELNTFRDQTIIGVVKDFHIKSLYSKIKPLVIGYDPDFPFYYCEFDMMVLKIAPNNVSATLKAIQNKWNEIYPQVTFTSFFLDENFDEQFQQIEFSRDLFSYFSFLAIFIACLGLFGIASFYTEQKTKEIGIRKVFGSDIKGIIYILGKELILLIILSVIVAFPISYFVLNSWLQNFPYHVNISIPLLLIPSIIVLILGIITVSLQSVKAAMKNPVDVLKYE